MPREPILNKRECVTRMMQEPLMKELAVGSVNMRHQKDFGCLFELVAGCEGCDLTKDVTAIGICTLYNQQWTAGVRVTMLASKCSATSASSRSRNLCD